MKRILICMLIFGMVLGAVPVSAVGTSAKAAVVINGDTGEIIYAQNCDERLPMASTTKIMTALLLAEENTPEKQITVTKEMVTVEGSSMGLLPGDTVSYNDLLYGMLLSSGNDAANTTAICVAGSVENFVERMNERAREMGLENTSFVTPSGLDADEHYTTAYELALIAREALKNEAFAEAAASRTATLCYGNPPYRRTLTNHNKLLDSYEGLVGVKTGFTKKSGRCLVTAAKRDGEYVLAVTLCDPNDWADHTALLDYGFQNIRAVECVPPSDLREISVVGGVRQAVGISAEKFNIGVTAEGEITCKTVVPEFVYAPVKQGDVLGRAEYYIGDVLLGASDITAESDVEEAEESLLKRFLGCFIYILSMV